MNPFSIDVKDYTVAAGVPLRIYMPASFFQLMEATGPVDVEFLRSDSTFGRAADVPLGFSVGPLRNDETFDAVEILSATTQTVKLCFARGSVDLRALTQVTGTVQVVNGELSRVIAGECFIGRPALLASAGNYSYAQLWNPVGSVKNLMVSKLQVMSNLAGELQLRVATAALTGLVTEKSNKMFGGLASTAEIRTQALAAHVGSIIGAAGSSAPWDSPEYPFSEPLLVPPGYGICVATAAVNQSVYATFQWFEEPV